MGQIDDKVAKLATLIVDTRKGGGTGPWNLHLKTKTQLLRAS